MMTAARARHAVGKGSSLKKGAGTGQGIDNIVLSAKNTSEISREFSSRGHRRDATGNFDIFISQDAQEGVEIRLSS